MKGEPTGDSRGGELVGEPMIFWIFSKQSLNSPQYEPPYFPYNIVVSGAL